MIVLVHIELLALPNTLYAQTMIVCGDFFYSTKYWIEQFEVLPCPTRRMMPAPMRSPCSYIIMVFRTRRGSPIFFTPWSSYYYGWYDGRFQCSHWRCRLSEGKQNIKTRLKRQRKANVRRSAWYSLPFVFVRKYYIWCCMYVDTARPRTTPRRRRAQHKSVLKLV